MTLICFWIPVSSGSEKTSFPLATKPEYDFSESFDRRANLSAFSSDSVDPLTPFIFGPDKDSDPSHLPSGVASSRSPEQAHGINTIPTSPALQRRSGSSSIQVQKDPVKEAKTFKKSYKLSPFKILFNMQPESSLDQSNTEETAISTGTYGPLAAAAAGRLSAFQNWLRRDGSASKESTKEASCSPPRTRWII